jgi:pyruvate kinase
VKSHKGVNLPGVPVPIPSLTRKDLEDLNFALAQGVDFVALSFVRAAADVRDLQAIIRQHGSPARVIAKIEKAEAIEALEEVLIESDAIMVARGDLGVEIGAATVPLLQKRIILRCLQVGKPVITATQMLESMIEAAEPTRAEVADVANAVIDGTSAVMLSAETSVGAYPVEAVLTMARIAEAAEEAPEIHGRAREVAPDTTAGGVMHAAVELAEELDATAIIVPTSTGGAPRACAKYRRRRLIVALAHSPRVADQLTLEWGVYATTIPVAESVDALIDSALLVALVLKEWARAGLSVCQRTGESFL